jgi:hypothetical protein
MNRSFKCLAIVPGGLPHSRTRPQQNHIASKEKAQNPDRNLFTSALRSGNDGRLGPPEPISRLMALVRSNHNPWEEASLPVTVDFVRKLFNPITRSEDKGEIRDLNRGFDHDVAANALT